MTPANLAPRRPTTLDGETTTILPRSRPTKHRTQALDAIDDYDEDERRTLGRGGKLALIIGSIAAVVVIGLLIGYAVRSAVNQPESQPSVAPSADGNSNGAAQPPGQSGNAVLSDGFMLNPSQAKAIDRNQNWKVASTQHSATAGGPTAACFGGEPPEGQPTPRQEFVRVLKGGSGKNAPLALHAATAYDSADEAAQAYAIAAKTLGGCTVAGFWIESGHLVSRIGNQAAGVAVMERDGKNWRAHSVVLNRSGAVVNVLDAVQPSNAFAVNGVAKALGQVNSVQCSHVGGDCSNKPVVEDGPPPIGGDEPGFFASGDLPPAGPKVYPWVSTDVEAPREEFKGSGCESVNWDTEPAKSKNSRVYLIQESGKNFFGLNEIVLTTKNHRAAGKLVDRIKSNLSRCKSRQLTATVRKARKVTGVGAQKTTVSGWTTVVSQKSTQGTATYRVGIVSAGPKVVYTFLNPRAEYDFTNHQWNVVAVRGGERATQVD